MRKLLGRYFDVPVEKLMDYVKIDNRYLTVLSSIYHENEGKIPIDMVAYFSDIISYDTYSKNIVKNFNSTVEINKLNKVYNFDRIHPERFSESLRDLFLRFNIVPYDYDDNYIYLATPMGENKSLKDPEYYKFISTIKSTIGPMVKNNEPRIVRVTNKLFADMLYTSLSLELYTADDMILLEDHALDLIFVTSVVKNASDIYMDMKNGKIDISFSIFGDNTKFRSMKGTRQESLNLMKALIGRSSVPFDDKDYKNKSSDDFRIQNLGNQNYKYYGRAQVLVMNGGEKLSPVIRVSEQNKSLIPYDKLKLSSEVKSKLEDCVMSKSGIVLVCGATGSGKSTTLSSLTGLLLEKRSRDRIEEISKPVEAYIDNISQIDIGDAAVSIADMVQSETRRNAQILIISELNEFGVLRAAVELAMQGKLVLSTLHAVSDSFVFDRVRGMCLENEDIYNQFVELIIGVTHQTMVKEACPSCSEWVLVEKLPQAKKDVLKAFNYRNEKIKVNGDSSMCDKCGGIGVLINKPVIISSILEVDNTMRDEILRRGKGIRRFIEDRTYEKETHELFDCVRYLEKGIVTLDEVWYNLNMHKVDEALLKKIHKS